MVVERAIICAPCERVFDYRLDVANLPRYNPGVSDLQVAGGGAPGVGSSCRFRVRLAPGLSLRCRLTVVEAVRPHRIRFAVESLLQAQEVCTFEPAQDKTHVRFETSVATPGGPLAKLLDALLVVPTARRQIRRELELMKRELESNPVAG